MPGYIDKVLVSGERVAYRGRVSLWSMLPLIVLGVISLPIMGVGILFLLTALIRYTSTELAITNKRVIAKFGFISRNTIEINLNKIESIQVHQHILARMLDYGTLVISGAGNPVAPIPGIADPLGFRRAFVETQEAALAAAQAARLPAS